MSEHDALRLSVLLTWAIEFVERETGYIKESYRDPVTGDCDDEDISADVADAERWLAEAREAVK